MGGRGLEKRVADPATRAPREDNAQFPGYKIAHELLLVHLPDQ
jgi:hypothetical protein